MGMSLYNLTGNFLALQEMMMDPDVDPKMVQDTLDAMDGDYEEKLENYGKVITNLSVLAAGIEEEEKRLNARKKTIKNQIDRLKKNIKESMIALDKRKVKTELYSYTIRDGVPSVVIDNTEKVPKEFRTPQPDKIDMDGIKRLLKSSDKDFNEYAHLRLGDPSLLMK